MGARHQVSLEQRTLQIAMAARLGISLAIAIMCQGGLEAMDEGRPVLWSIPTQGDVIVASRYPTCDASTAPRWPVKILHLLHVDDPLTT